MFQGERGLVHEEIQLDYGRVLTHWGDQLGFVHCSKEMIKIKKWAQKML
jgi:hypothetical protein